MLSKKEDQKKDAAQAALKHIENDQIIGVGSGSTIEYFIELLKRKMETENLRIKAVPTSYQSALSLMVNQIPLTTLDEHDELDLAVDGACRSPTSCGRPTEKGVGRTARTPSRTSPRQG